MPPARKKSVGCLILTVRSARATMVKHQEGKVNRDPLIYQQASQALKRASAQLKARGITDF